MTDERQKSVRTGMPVADMTDDTPMTILLDQDRKGVRLTISTGQPVTLHLDTAALEHLINQLGNIRSMMAPEVSPSWPFGQKAHAGIQAPVICTEQEALRRRYAAARPRYAVRVAALPDQPR